MYDRNFLLLYMMNVRDLEVTKSCIQKIKIREKSIIDKKINNILIRRPSYKEEPSDNVSHVGTSGILLLVLGLLILVLDWLLSVISGDLTKFSKGVAAFFGIVGLFMLLFGYLRRLKYKVLMEEWEDECAEINAYNRAVKEKRLEIERQAKPLREQWEAVSRYLDGEIQKTDSLLTDLYSMNILPKNFRHDLAAVCYIYDYISSSNESWENALHHAHIEDGIRRIEAKLDEIIDLLQTYIYETRCMRRENQTFHDQLKNQNQRMLSSLKKTEANTLKTAQYSQLISDDTRAVAFFEAANYLKNN